MKDKNKRQEVGGVCLSKASSILLVSATLYYARGFLFLIGVPRRLFQSNFNFSVFHKRI